MCFSALITVFLFCTFFGSWQRRVASLPLSHRMLHGFLFFHFENNGSVTLAKAPRSFSKLNFFPRPSTHQTKRCYCRLSRKPFNLLFFLGCLLFCHNYCFCRACTWHGHFRKVGVFGQREMKAQPLGWKLLVFSLARSHVVCVYASYLTLAKNCV